MRDDGWSFYWTNVKVHAARGGVGLRSGATSSPSGSRSSFLVVPLLEQPLMQLGIVSYCLPVIAIGPILQIIFNGDTPKIILAALSVFFTTLVGMLVGLRSAEPDDARRGPRLRRRRGSPSS